MSSEEARIGIYMKVYRNEESMHKAIQSVLDQTYKNFRYYILVNETTRGVVESYAGQDERIEIIDGEKTDNFKTRAKTIAKENAYVTTIDADDWYDSRYLEVLLREAIQSEADIVACGNYFIGGDDKIIGERAQKKIVWSFDKTGKVLPFIYGHFRTVWGKLIRSEVLIRCDFGLLPKEESYGWYGGDTMVAFSLLQCAKQLCVCDSTLYNYRLVQSGSSYRLKDGRLDSDEVLFRFIEKVLRTSGEYGEGQKRYLFWVYGNALADTVRLLLKAEMPEEEQTQKLIYVFEKPLTKELFLRENLGLLDIPELGNVEKFSDTVYAMLFAKAETFKDNVILTENYLHLLKIIFPKLEEVLDREKLCLLLKSRKILDILVAGNYQMVTEVLIALYSSLVTDEKRNGLELIHKLSSNVFLKKAVQEPRMLEVYPEVLRAVNQEHYEVACDKIKEVILSDKIPVLAVELVDLWNNLAAQAENVAEFILSKQLKVDILRQCGRTEEALCEYKELTELGVDDDNMKYLRECLEQ